MLVYGVIRDRWVSRLRVRITVSGQYRYSRKNRSAKVFCFLCVPRRIGRPSPASITGSCEVRPLGFRTQVVQRGQTDTRGPGDKILYSRSSTFYLPILSNYTGNKGSYFSNIPVKGGGLTQTLLSSCHVIIMTAFDTPQDEFLFFSGDRRKCFVFHMIRINQ